MPKPGALLDTDTVPDMVLVDMEVTVLALPAMEVTVLDTVSGRDLLMPKPGALLDTDTVPDMVLVDMEVTDTVDTDTESKFCVSMSLLPYILTYLLKHENIPFLLQKQKKLSLNMFHQELRKSFEIDKKLNPKNKLFHKKCAIFLPVIFSFPQS